MLCILQISHLPVVTQLVGVRTGAHTSPNQPSLAKAVFRFCFSLWQGQGPL